MDINERKKQLEKEMNALLMAENAENEKKIRDENFQRFMRRGVDWIIGKAHAQFDFQDHGWHIPKGEFLNRDVLPICVHIDGNCGHEYYAVAEVTAATITYFHNVIPDAYQTWFAGEMKRITKELMEKVLSNPRCVLELMGLQSTHHFKSEQYFNEEDIPKVESEMEKAQDEILSRFPVGGLKALKNLAHGGAILAGHLKRRSK